MSRQANPAPAGRDPDTYPLRFKKHNFEAHCYNTSDCHVIYNGTNTTRTAVDRQIGPPPSSDYKKNWGGAVFGGIPNFPGPAKVEWTTRDGQTLRADIDLADIFKDELVLHRVPLDEIPERAFKGPAGEPTIFLEVDNRTINVYMQMLIPTKSEQIPGNPNSHFRNDTLRAWSKTY